MLTPQTKVLSKDDVKVRSEIPVLFLYFMAAGILVSFPLFDPDTFWHLANGREMVSSGTIVNQEIFSYTANGTHFWNHEWLSQVIMYLSYLWHGAYGLAVFKLILTISIAAVLYATARMMGCKPVISAILCFFIIFAALERFRERPQLFSIAGLALLGIILYGYRAGRFGTKALYCLVPIMILWDFLHGAIYGTLLLGTFAGGEALKHIFRTSLPDWQGMRPMPPERLKAFLLWTGITYGLMILNPYGPRSYDLFVQFVKGSNTMVSMTAEFLPPPLEDFLRFWALLGLSALVILWPSKKIDLTHVLVFLPFAYLAVRYARAIEAFNPVVLPMLSLGIKNVMDKIRGKQSLEVVSSVIVVLALTLTVSYLVYFKFLSQRHLYSFGYGIDEKFFPRGSVRFIESADLRGNMYNSDRCGGYLAYMLAPERKIFHYNHHMIFKDLELYVHNRSSRERYGINYAVVNREDEFDMFVKDNFIPVYWEPSGAVLVRNIPGGNQKIIEQYGIRFFQPLMDETDLRSLAARPEVFPVLVREMTTYLSYRKDHRIAGIFTDIIRDPRNGMTSSERIGMLSKAELYNGDSPKLEAGIGTALYKERKLDEAHQKFLRALELDKTLRDARLNLAYIEFDKGQYRRAAEHFEYLLSMNSLDPDALYGLALANYAMKDYDTAKELWRKYLQLVPTGKWAETARAMLSALPR